MEPPDLTAFLDCGVQYRLLDHPAAAVIAAQMWCPIAVEHFCSLIYSPAKSRAVCPVNKKGNQLMRAFCDTLQFLSELPQADPQKFERVQEFARIDGWKFSGRAGLGDAPCTTDSNIAHYHELSTAQRDAPAIPNSTAQFRPVSPVPPATRSNTAQQPPPLTTVLEI